MTICSLLQPHSTARRKSSEEKYGEKGCGKVVCIKRICASAVRKNIFHNFCRFSFHILSEHSKPVRDYYWFRNRKGWVRSKKLAQPSITIFLLSHTHTRKKKYFYSDIIIFSSFFIFFSLYIKTMMMMRCGKNERNFIERKNSELVILYFKYHIMIINFWVKNALAWKWNAFWALISNFCHQL